MAGSPRDKLRVIVEDVHEAVVRARDQGGGTPETPPGLGEHLAAAGFSAPESADHAAVVCATLVDAGAGDDVVVGLLDTCLTSASPDWRAAQPAPLPRQRRRRRRFHQHHPPGPPRCATWS